jgi:peptidoglycan hydrolase-like amidase
VSIVFSSGKAAGAVIAAVLVLPMWAASAQAVEDYSVQSDQTFTFVGRGYGHGRGMSQYGAFHAATIGQSARQITDRYYSTSTAGTVANAQLRVRLERSVNDRLVYFPSVTGLTARDESTGGGETKIDPAAFPGVSRWRVVTDSAGLRVQSETGTGGWATLQIGSRTAFPGTVRIFSNSVSSLRIQDEDESGTRAYRGNFRINRINSSDITAVNVVPLEAYLRSVVPSESPASWPAAALQAQAIAARSYSSWHKQHPKDAATYDICDNQNCQVYSGTSGEDSRTDAAVSATAGQARTISGAAIRAEFASTNGGWIEAGGPGHSAPGRDAWTDGSWDPYHQWQASFTASQLAQKFLPGGSTLSRVEIVSRDGIGDWGGRPTEMLFTGTNAGLPVQRTVTGAAFRTAMGASTVRSTLFTVGDSSGLRWIKSSNHATDGSQATHTYGPQDATPLLGDWDGDGDQTPGVLDVVNGAWRWRLSNANSVGSPDLVFSYGPASCTPVAGDWDGDGDETPGLACPSDGHLLWRLSNVNGTSAPAHQFLYGPATATPLVGDWNNDGQASPGVVRSSSTGLLWQLRNALWSGAPAFQFSYGSNADRPVVGDWDGNGSTTVGVTRPTGERWNWILRNSNTAGGASYRQLAGLITGQTPRAGDWDGNGTATPVMVD